MIAEICIVTGDKLHSLIIFFTLLPIMVDDYLAIHYYFEKFHHMNSWHRFKKNLFNIFLFSFSILSLISIKSYFLIFVYLIFTSVLYFLNPKES